ncbi:MAG: DUF4397 domain-containing protein [Ignavibacteria bacterium]
MIKKISETKVLHSILFTIITLFAITIFNGCNEDNPINPSQTARLQITHASPDAPNLDIYIGTTLIASNLSYLETLTYFNVTGNTVSEIIMNAAGTSTTLIDTAVYFSTNTSSSFFAYDSLQDIQPLILTDDLTSPGTTNARLRFIDLSPNSPSLDVGGVGKVQPWFPFYTFPQSSEFRAITGGTYDIYANLSGTGTTLVTLTGQNMPAGKIFTVIANGYNGASGLQSFGLTLIPNN